MLPLRLHLLELRAHSKAYSSQFSTALHKYKAFSGFCILMQKPKYLHGISTWYISKSSRYSKQFQVNILTKIFSIFSLNPLWVHVSQLDILENFYQFNSLIDYLRKPINRGGAASISDGVFF